MNEITITKEKFNKAVADAVIRVTELMDDESKDTMTNLILSMNGMIFAKEVEKILFEEITID